MLIIIVVNKLLVNIYVVSIIMTIMMLLTLHFSIMIRHKLIQILLLLMMDMHGGLDKSLCNYYFVIHLVMVAMDPHKPIVMHARQQIIKFLLIMTVFAILIMVTLMILIILAKLVVQVDLRTPCKENVQLIVQIFHIFLNTMEVVFSIVRILIINMNLL